MIMLEIVVNSYMFLLLLVFCIYGLEGLEKDDDLVLSWCRLGEILRLFILNNSVAKVAQQRNDQIRVAFSRNALST